MCWTVQSEFLGTYKLNVLTRLGLLLLCMTFYLCSYTDFFVHLTFLIIGSHIVFISILGLRIQCSALSIILTSSHKGRWFPFSFHIWSAIPDFSISPHTTTFRYSSSLTFSRWPVSLLYILPQLQGME